MNLKQVEAFRAVMRTGSMTIAAAQLFTSQPNVSRAVARLQRETGLRLFERIGSRIVATPEAHALLREVDRVFIGLDSITDAAARIRLHGVQGLRVAATPALGISLVPRVVKQFREARPGVPVTLQISESTTICRWVATGHCDLGVVAAMASPHEVTGQLLFAERGVCIVPAGHRLQKKRKVKVVDLAGECFISMPPYDPARRAVDRLFDPETRKLDLEASHASAICFMVALGMGVSIVNPVLHRELGLPGIHAIPFEPRVEFRCYTVRTKDRPEQAIVADFVEVLQATIAPGAEENSTRGDLIARAFTGTRR